MEYYGGSAPPSPSAGMVPDFTPAERQAFCDDAARATAYATAQLRRYAVINPQAARDAAWAASDTLHVAAKALGNPHLRRAADAYDRTARAPYGRIPKRSPTGDGLRTAARVLAMAGRIGDQTTVNILVLVTNLIALMEAVAQLHQAQQRTAQAAAARTTGNHLRHAGQQPEGATPWLSEDRRTLSAFDLAMADFPMPWSPNPSVRQTDGASGQRPPGSRQDTPTSSRSRPTR